jgi:t-SNARE complex subunit (syntaxin)
MKTTVLKIIGNNLVLAAGLALLAGCVSASYDKGADTSAALKSSAAAVGDTSAKVNDVLGALNALTFKAEGDLRKQYDAFTDATKNLDKSSDKLAAQVSAMRDTAAAYFQNWSNQMSMISSEDLRKMSAERRDAVSDKLNTVDASYMKVKNSLQPFMSDLKDIQTYLGTDLTAAGLDTIKGTVSKTKVDAVPLRDSIKQLQTSFSDLAASLSPVLPTPDSK